MSGYWLPCRLVRVCISVAGRAAQNARSLARARLGRRIRLADGRAEVDRALALGGRGPYVLQAAIASSNAG